MPPRFIVKFVNGIWTIFDTVEFKNCEPNLGTRKNAAAVRSHGHAVRWLAPEQRESIGRCSATQHQPEN
jgi:hypothetical protein